MIAIAGVGIITGGEPVDLPWPVRSPRRYRPAGGGFGALVERALATCGGGGPVVIGSCNGKVASWDAADWRTSFELGGDMRTSLAPGSPVASASCASGLHALYLACALIEAGEPEVRVVAADIVTPPAHDNFEALRVLSDAPAPFTPDATGFQLGEAAVALHLVESHEGPRLIGPVLGHDLDGDDGLDRVLGQLHARPGLVLGQGTGPVEVDRAELAAIARHVEPQVPLATALHSLGHTLGASSLLSVALAARGRGLTSAASHALDGRPLGSKSSATTLVVCRALGGACGACVVGHARVQPAAPVHAAASQLPPLRDPTLRAIAAAAGAHRPSVPPELLVVTLDAPLPPSARIGARILPTSVLEMTPGFVPQLVARAWGYRGPAVCLVGGDPEPLLAACRETREVYRIAIRGMEQRDVEWNA